jgi:voltage-gated potassium channel
VDRARSSRPGELSSRSSPRELLATLTRLLPQRAEFRRFLWGVSLLLLSLVVGCLFYMGHGWSFSDAAYMVVISVTTVGYDEVRPIDTVGLRLTTTFVLLLGLVGNALLIAAMADILISRSFRLALGRSNLEKRIESLNGHVIVVGYGRMGQETAHRVANGGMDVVVVENQPEHITMLNQAEILHVEGDGMSEAILIAAGIERAAFIVCLLGNDVDNVFVTLSARQLNPLIRIITKADQQTSSRKLYQAGANHVISPFSMGSIRISHLLLNPVMVELSDAISMAEGEDLLQLYEVRAERLPNIVGITFKQFRSEFPDIQAVVLGIRHNSGTVSFPPPTDHRISASDGLIMLIRKADIASFETEMSTFGADRPRDNDDASTVT